MIFKFDYTFFYAESSLICIILFSLLLCQARKDIDRSEDRVMYYRVLLWHILFFFFDALWALNSAGRLFTSRFWILLVDYFCFLSIHALAGNWVLFTEIAQDKNSFLCKRSGRLMLRASVYVPVFLIGLSYLSRPSLWLDAGNKETELYYITMVVQPGIYLLSACIKSLLRAFRRKNYASRGQFLLQGIYPLVIGIGGILQIRVLQTPLMCFLCALAMLYLYISMLQDQLSTDTLTGLNNRNQFRRYLSQIMNEGGNASGRYYVMMLDLNNFKTINDTWGHLEGDHALKIVGASLLHVCSYANREKQFAARYGGDEFIIIAKAELESEILLLREEIRRDLKRRASASGCPYPLTAGIGYAPLARNPEGVKASIAEADAAMYRDKKRQKNIA